MMNEDNIQLMKSLGLNPDYPFVLFRLSDVTYAISSLHVRSMEPVRDVTEIPEAPDYMTGIVRFRDRYIPLVSLRRLFGMSSRMEEMETRINFRQRAKDHENWVTELEASVRERRAFTLTDDPHKCALGRWLDSFSTDNNELAMHIRRLHEPHRAVHETAKTVASLMRENRYDEALQQVEVLRRTGYAETMEILSSVGEAYQNGLKEMLIVVDNGSFSCGAGVDELVAVEYLEEVFSRPSRLSTDVVLCISRRRSTGEHILVLSCEELQRRIGDISELADETPKVADQK